jgi:ABC-type multidrug transport system permease subunit
MKSTKNRLMDNLNIIWTISSKDIVDALRNKLIMSLIMGLSLMLIMPKVMGLAIDPPYTSVLVFDPGSSLLASELEDSPQFNVIRANSISSLKEAIGSSMAGLGVEFGVAIPADFNQSVETGELAELEGYLVWANRIKGDQLKTDFEGQFADLIGEPVRINIEDNLVYPPSNSPLFLSVLTWTSVIVILSMGLNLVPHLLFEEKQTKTLDALLVSPASAGMVVVGKALAGLFYILVTAGVVFAINWAGVVHWEIAALFAIVSGLFCVALGLVLGSFYDRQQEIVGLTMVLLVILVGALFISGMDLEIPAAIQALVPWIPSVALSNILQLSYLESAPWDQLWLSLGSLFGFSILLYAMVVWKLRRLDR